MTKEEKAAEEKQKRIEALHIKAIEASKKKGVYFIEDVIAFLPIGKTSFYEYWKIGSNEMNVIVEILDENKISMKVKIREKLAAGSKAPELVALYKLLASDDERRKLSSQYIDHTTKGKELKAPTIINYNDLSEDTLADIIANTESTEEKKEDDGE